MVDFAQDRGLADDLNRRNIEIFRGFKSNAQRRGCVKDAVYGWALDKQDVQWGLAETLAQTKRFIIKPKDNQARPWTIPKEKSTCI
jgi:hypothetical protein